MKRNPLTLAALMIAAAFSGDSAAGQTMKLTRGASVETPYFGGNGAEANRHSYNWPFSGKNRAARARLAAGFAAMR